MSRSPMDIFGTTGDAYLGIPDLFLWAFDFRVFLLSNYWVEELASIW